MERNSRVWVDAATVVTHGDRWLAVRRARAVVAGRGGDEHAGGVGVEERQLHRVGERIGAAGDREVDHVDAVEDGLADGRGGVGVEAALRCRSTL